MDSAGFRRRSHRESNGFQSGYVPVDEDYLQHSGIRGKRSCCLCTLLVILLLIAVINALVTVGLVYFMSVTHEGMMSIEFLPGGERLRTLLDVYVNRVKIKSGLLGGRAGKDLVIDGRKMAGRYVDRVKFKSGLLGGRTGKDLIINGRKVMLNQSADASISLDDSSTMIIAKEFRLMTTQGKQLFSPSDQTVSSPVYEAVNLHAPEIECGSISSHKQIQDLHLKSYHDLTVLGMEGIQISSEGDLDLKARDIVVEAVEGLGMKNQEGIFLHPNLPTGGKDLKQPGVKGQLKLCVCMPSGKLFAVPVVDENSGCHRANDDVNACHS